VAASDLAMLVALVELGGYSEVDYCVTSSDPDRRATAAKAKCLEEVREGSALFADMSVALAGAWSSHLGDMPTPSALPASPASLASAYPPTSAALPVSPTSPASADPPAAAAL
jgi:hypothetical protein